MAKVRADGTGLAYCGYIGGSGSEFMPNIAVDSLGNAYVAGTTSSGYTTFPVIVGPDMTYNGGEDAFVAKISPPAYPPLNFQLQRLENDLIFFKEYVNQLSWAPNPLNLGVIVKYRLYRKAKSEPNAAFDLYQELDGSATSFDDRGLKKDDLFAYRITAVNWEGRESQPVEAGN